MAAINGGVYLSFGSQPSTLPTTNPTTSPTNSPSTTFSCTGSMQQYTVPSNTYSLLVNMTGGSGSVAGGLGGFISCKISVTPNQILYVSVGCAGSSNSMGGYGGGGNGASTSNCQSGGAVRYDGGGIFNNTY